MKFKDKLKLFVGRIVCLFTRHKWSELFVPIGSFGVVTHYARECKRCYKYEEMKLRVEKISKEDFDEVCGIFHELNKQVSKGSIDATS